MARVNCSFSNCVKKKHQGNRGCKWALFGRRQRITLSILLGGVLFCFCFFFFKTLDCLLMHYNHPITLLRFGRVILLIIQVCQKGSKEGEACGEAALSRVSRACQTTPGQQRRRPARSRGGEPQSTFKSTKAGCHHCPL